MLIRDATRTPQFLGLDARAFAFSSPAFLFINLWTMLFVVLFVGFFVVLKIKGIEFAFAYRRSRALLRGAKVESRPWWFLKKWRVR